MKINVNSTKVQALLDAANGTATRHTITSPEEVSRVAEAAENALEKLGLPKSHRPGARAEHVSGKGLPNAYKYRGIATEIRLVRGARAWYLTAVERAPAYPGDTGRETRISVSAEQDRLAGEARRRALGITVTSAAA